MERYRHFRDAAEYFLCREVVSPVMERLKMFERISLHLFLSFACRMLPTRLDMSKLTGALCSVLSVNPLRERQFSSSIAESFETRSRLTAMDSTLPDLCAGISSLIAPGAEQLILLLLSKPLHKQSPSETDLKTNSMVFFTYCGFGSNLLSSESRGKSSSEVMSATSTLCDVFFGECDELWSSVSNDM